MRIAIVGGGMGGLTAALSLLRAGFDVEVLEQAPEPKELGAGLWISANGTRVLFSLGLEAALKRINLPPEDRVVRLWDSGQIWSLTRSERISRADHTLYMVLRSELHRILSEEVQRLKPGAVRFNARCIGFEPDAGAVTVRLEDGASLQADVLVGADGIHSKVRQILFGAAPALYTGVLAWRGLAPMARLPAQHRRPLAASWLGPTAHVTSFPVQRGGTEMVSFSGQVERSGWHAESWSEQGSLEECLHDFAGWHEDIQQLFRAADVLYKWGIFERPALHAWSKGRVTLLGDAAHPMAPYLGQGLNSAIEDGCILARCLLAHAGEPALALQRYQEARMERLARIVDRSAGMRHTFHHPALGEPAEALDYVGKHWHPDQVKARYDWIVSYDATRISL